MRRLRTLAILGPWLALAGAPAYADIYTWTDANGVVNVSNIAPPAGARVSNVTVERPVPPSPQADAAREAARQAQLVAMSERIRQLENDAQAAPPPMLPPPSPPVIVAPVYVPMPIFMPPPTPVVAPYAEPPPVPTCDPLSFGCPYVVPTTLVLTTIVPRRSPYTTKPPGGPVLWPVGNRDALGPWAPGISTHLPSQPHHPRL